jgi:hypothetical protein
MYSDIDMREIPDTTEVRDMNALAPQPLGRSAISGLMLHAWHT